jgi:hypothetical protein
MVMMFKGGVVLMLDGTFRTIPTVEKLWGGSFSFPPEPIAVKLLTSVFQPLLRYVDTPDNCTRVKILKAPGAADFDAALVLIFFPATAKTNLLSLLPFPNTVGDVGVVDSHFSDNTVDCMGQ